MSNPLVCASQRRAARALMFIVATKGQALHLRVRSPRQGDDRDDAELAAAAKAMRIIMEAKAQAEAEAEAQASAAAVGTLTQPLPSTLGSFDQIGGLLVHRSYLLPAACYRCCSLERCALIYLRY